MIYRNSIQIMGDILDNSLCEIQSTKLLTKSNLSHNRFKGFINKLMSNDLINKIEFDGKNTFIITEKGRLYLEEFKRFQKIIDSFGL
jgi:predicted transcriptional regulator